MDTRRPARPRQADIARAAQVSQATVSIVLNGNPEAVGLAPDTVRRVHEAAEVLGYVADPVAVRLAGRHNQLLGVYTFSATFPVDVRNSYYPFLAGVEERAAARGYDLVLFTGTSGVADVQGNSVDHALRRVRIADGCILFGRQAPIPVLERLLDDGFPFVYIGRRDELGDRIPYIGADYVQASRDVVQRLAELGHRSLVYLREPTDEPPTEDRAQGVQDGHDAVGGELHVVRTEGQDIDRRWVEEQVAGGVTAFVVESTELHAILVEALAESGLRCPGQISVAVLSDDVATEERVISGFALPRQEMGRQAADLLIDVLTGATPSGDHQRLLACTPVAGQTVGPPRSVTRR